jgi:hypothetical protein
MNAMIRSGALTAVAFATVFLIGFHLPPAIEEREGNSDSKREMLEEQIEFESSQKVAEVFGLQRAYGNEGINIDAKLWEAFEKVQAARCDPLSKSAASAGIWKEEGPWNVAGRIRSLAVHPTDNNILYAGAASGGVWKTTNQGLSWFPLNDTLPALPVGAVAIDRSNPNKIVAGLGEPEPNSMQPRINATPIYSRSLGIMRSDDAGATWRLHRWTTTESRAVHRIALHPVSSDTLLVATLKDLWKSTNGGRNWTKVYSGISTDVVYAPGRPSRVYAAIGDDYGDVNSGVYVSDAGGNVFSWRKLSVNFPAGDSCGRIILGIAETNPNHMYAAVALNRDLASPITSDFFAFMISTNGGESWERKRNPISASFCNGQASFDLCLAVSPTDENMVFLGGINLYRSSNGGYSFTKITESNAAHDNPGYAHADHHSLVFKPGDGNTLFDGGDGGMHMTTDQGGTWKTRIANLGTIQFYSCSFDPSNPTYYYGGTQDNGSLGKVSADNAGWSEIWGGDGANVVVDPQKSNTRYVCSTPSTSVRTILRIVGGTGTLLNLGLNAGPAADHYNWLPPLLLHPADRTRLYTATNYVYVMKNPDGASPSWNIISPDLTVSSSYYTVTKMAVAPTNREWMYAVTSNARAWITKNLSDIDVAWTQISSGLPARWLSDVSVDWDDPSTAYVACSGYGTGHVYKTSNAGVNWTNISGDLPDVPAGAVVRSRTDANALFLATDLGVWFTQNGGQNWRRYGEGMPNVIVYDMKLTPDNTLLAGTHGRGMWTTSAVVSADPASADYPRTFTLGKAYPNPAVTAATVPFALSEPALVTISLYSSSGALVAPALRERYHAGKHSREISATGLTPGMYYYVVDAAGARQTGKLAVVR